MTNTHRDSHSRVTHHSKIASIGSPDQRGDAIICSLGELSCQKPPRLKGFIRSGTGHGPILVSAAGASMANPFQLTACMRSNAVRSAQVAAQQLGMGGGKKR